MEQLRLFYRRTDKDNTVVDEVLEVRSPKHAQMLASTLDKVDRASGKANQFQLQVKVDEDTLHDWYGEEFVDRLDENGEYWDEWHDETGTNWVYNSKGVFQ